MHFIPIVLSPRRKQLCCALVWLDKKSLKDRCPNSSADASYPACLSNKRILHIRKLFSQSMRVLFYYRIWTSKWNKGKIIWTCKLNKQKNMVNPIQSILRQTRKTSPAYITLDEVFLISLQSLWSLGTTTKHKEQIRVDFNSISWIQYHRPPTVQTHKRRRFIWYTAPTWRPNQHS